MNSKQTKILSAIGLVGLIFVLFVGQKAFALYMQLKDPEPILFWSQSNEQSTATVDHSQWQDFLNNYIIEHEKINYVAYNDVSEDDYQNVTDYIEYLESIDPRNYNKEEQMAYWINLYNAVTIQVILDEYPVDSIKETGGGLPGMGPWEDELVEVAGQPLSLNNIEHGILRRIWSDNRIHYGVNCASIGCPNLSTQAYTGENIETLLDVSAEAFINSQRGVTFGVENGQEILVLSSIFSWFISDFGNNEISLIADIQRYASADLREKLKSYNGKIEYEYDWALNDADVIQESIDE